MGTPFLLSSFAKGLLAISGLVIVFTGNVRADVISSVRLLLTTCVEPINNLAQVDRIAAERKWKRNTAAQQTKKASAVRSRSIWQAAHDGREYLVATSTANLRDGKLVNMCTIVFEKTPVNASDLQKKLSESLKLKMLAETKLSNANMFVYEIENRPKRVLLQMTAKTDGNLVQASIVAPQ